MKKVLIVIIAMVMAAPTFAQQKFGHIDSAALLELMPEKVQAEKELEAFAKEFQSALEAMAKEYEGKVAAFQATEKDMISTVKNSKVREISDLERRIQEFQQQAQEGVLHRRPGQRAWASKPALTAIAGDDVGQPRLLRRHGCAVSAVAGRGGRQAPRS